ncbi:ATP-dependent RNA helicase DDX49/DBP8 [Nematocida displodere]|uniref:ATP-dependent RNA helicase DDX49/DBP8 n=1 Tax=Nematocida displodere TaxID=1805483 RepID=A0A177EKN6_9MICR|nr:ATP-dependent RNA helicase DDX49/DBP8 [Nematocida displodere]
MSFSVHEEMNDILKRIGYTTKTEIQKALLPLKETKDIIALSETGTGKTACFVIPIVEELGEDPYGIHSLIIAPTRELCLQTKEQVDVIGNYFGIKCEIIHGGIDVHKQVSALHRKPHVVISTPGRLAAMLCTEESVMCFKRVKKVVLDEADLLLNGSQAPAVYTILQKLAHANASFQMLLLSATDITPRVPVKIQPENVENRANTANHANTELTSPEVWRMVMERSPITIDTRKEEIPQNITQEYALVHNQAKDGHLATLLLEEFRERRVVVFMNRSEDCTVLTEIMQELGINAVGLSRGMPSRERYSAFYKFKSGTARVLLTTDVASRGIDVKDVGCVINYDLPNDHIDYIHRVGRTGRLAAQGYALSFVVSRDAWLLKHIQSTLTTPIQEKKIKPFESPKLLNRISTHREFILRRVRGH